MVLFRQVPFWCPQSPMCRPGVFADPATGTPGSRRRVDHGDLLRAVRRRWWLVLGGILLGLAVATGLTWNATPLYASSAHFVVSMPGTSDSDGTYQGNLYAQQRSGSFARALRSEHLAGEVVDDLGLDLSAAEVARRITATLAPGTVVIEVTVTDSSATRARAIVGALEGRFAEWVAAAEAPAGPRRAGAEVTTVTAAALDTQRVSTDAGLFLGLGGSLGFLLGLGLAVLGAPSRRSVTSDEEVHRLTGAPLLASVPDLGPRDLADEYSPTADAFRALRMNLQLLDSAGLPPVVVVQGVVDEDAAETVARGLADALVRTGRRVAVVGAYSASEGAVDTVLATHDHVLVSVPTGTSSGNAVLVGLAGGHVLATRHGRTHPLRLAQAADALVGGGARLLGVVLTRVPPAAGVVQSRSHRYQADEDRGGAVAGRRTVQRTRAAEQGWSHV